ncbi:hypothetical protein B566_EDAN014345, partial [Ephemera danica]
MLACSVVGEFDWGTEGDTRRHAHCSGWKGAAPGYFSFVSGFGINGLGQGLTGNVKVCDIDDSIKERLKQFRFRKPKDNAALVLKVDRAKQAICVDEFFEV